jgi:hypothetical protein
LKEKKKMKKLLSAIIALLLCIPIVACDSGKNTDNNPNKENGNKTEETTTGNGNVNTPSVSGSENVNTPPVSGSEGENNGSEENDTTNLAEVFSVPGFESIGPFNNGVAPFTVRGQSPSWWRGYKRTYGYIDINGNVIADPTVDIPWYDIPSFAEYNYVNFGSKIIDKTGKILFEIGKDGVSAIGEISNGYFAVETRIEEFTGYVYTLTYYSANDARKIKEIPNMSYDDKLAVQPDGSVKDFFTYYFNVSEYDSSFVPKTDPWSVEVEKIESFQGVNCYYQVSSSNNSLGQIATVVLKNKDNISYYATVDSKGNVLMAPQKNISFKIDNGRIDPLCTFSNDLCAAQDASTSLWGFIDPHGEWVIQPQYYGVTPFGSSGLCAVQNEDMLWGCINTRGEWVAQPKYENVLTTGNDGYAIIDYATVIDTTGKTVLAQKTMDKSELVGNYSTEIGTGAIDKLVFYSNGSVKYIENYGLDYGENSFSGEYYINEKGRLVLDMWRYHGLVASDRNGEHTIQKDGDDLIINGVRWTKE